MAISGTTNTCQITTNTQFELSGLSQTNLSTINITDENGLDVSECFGIETNIITVDGDNVKLSGDCDTSLEIVITEGVSKPVECNFIRYTQDNDNFLTFYFSDGSSTDNTHPDCCTALGFTPEIGPDCYYICRWRDEIDPEDCNNYQPTFQETIEGWQVFEFAGGGDVSTVPSADCCYAYEWIEEVQPNGDIKCIIDVPFDPCGGLEVIKPTPDFGIITFLDPNTNSVETVVPNSECCTSNGFSFQVVTGGFECYNSLVSDPPEVTLTISDPCCEPSGIITIGEPPQCARWSLTNNSFSESIRFDYIDCSEVNAQFFVNIPPRTTVQICAVINQAVIDGNPNITFNEIPDQGICNNIEIVP